MRLIDAEEVTNKILYLLQGGVPSQDIRRGIKKIYTMLCDAPTIEAELVKRGRWIIGQCGKDKYIKCFVCKARIVDTIVSLEGDISQDYFVICPRCGARMDLRDGDGA